MKEKTCRLAEKVKTYIKRHNMLMPGSHVVVGVSGGPDSMCLLHILNRLREEYRLTLHAIHINHGLRGKEADEDQRFVEDWCCSHGIGFHSAILNVKEYALNNKLSIEEAGRELRYAEFQKYASALEEEGRADHSYRETVRIAIAQNLNDQAETILMRVFRGTGLDGLTGMEPVNGNIIRPLLETGRDEIEEYCLQNGIQTRTDRTNLETVYTRNKIRLECIPYICENFNPGIVQGLARMSAVLKEDRDFLQEESKRALMECSVADGAKAPSDVAPLILTIDLERLGSMHPAIKKRVLRLAVEQVKGDLKGIEAGHIKKITDLAGSGATGSVIHLPHDVRVEKSYSTLSIFISTGTKGKSNKGSKLSKGSTETRLNIPGESSGLEGKIKIFTRLIDLESETGTAASDYIHMHQHPAAMIQYFDYNKILGQIDEIAVRTRREGDVFRPMGMKGTKKLKEYFIDAKIPRNDRDNIPLIAAGKEIVWIAGFRTSDKYKPDFSTKKILGIEIQKQERSFPGV